MKTTRKVTSNGKMSDEIRVNTLIENSRRWHDVKILREYIQEVAKRRADTMNAELKEWLKWANEKADAMDPFMQEATGETGKNLAMQWHLLGKIASCVFSFQAKVASADDDNSNAIWKITKLLSAQASALLKRKPQKWSAKLTLEMAKLLKNVDELNNELNKRKAKNILIPELLLQDSNEMSLLAAELKALIT